MSSASRAAALVELLRPVNGLMAAVAVLVGAHVTRSPTFWGPALTGAAAAFAASGASNALNDRLDVVSDVINRPGRPIPSGRLTRVEAATTACVFGAASIALAALIGPRAVALALAWLVLTALYSVTLKGVPLAGNAAVALVASTPFLMGGFSQGKYLLAIIPCALAFLVHLAREIVKDVEDVEGDEAAGVWTFAVRRGAAASFAVVRGVLMILIALAALPFVFGIYGWGYASVLVVIDAALVRLMLSMEANSMSKGFSRPSNALKAVMVLGLLAFVVGVL
ncbi:MAG: geranylgeranylglycerol-phosphate geranylgeranyltransferase [Candidatus Eisenbacteria bacterium]